MNRFQLLVISFLALFASGALGQAHPVNHNRPDSRTFRLLERLDEAVVSSGSGRFTQSHDNRDRVHLRLTVSSSDQNGIGLAVPESWGEQRALNLLDSLEAALPNSLSRRTIYSYKGSLQLGAYFEGHSDRHGWKHAVTIGWPVLLKALARIDVQRVEIRLRARSLPTLIASKCGIEWTQTESGGQPILVALVPVSARVSEMTLTYGADPAFTRGASAIALAILLLPLLVMGVAATRVRDETGFNGFVKMRRCTQLAGTFAWLVAYTRGGVMLFVSLGAGGSPTGRTALVILGLATGPVILSLGSALITFPVEVKLRQAANSSAYFLRALAVPILILIPFIALMIGMSVAPDATSRFMLGTDGKGGLLGSPINMAIFAGIFFTIFLRITLYRMLKPQIVTSGELVERVKVLGREAGVEVSGVSIGRTQKVANAFVTATGTVLLTECLLKNFTRKEVDGIVAHELSHLRSNHLQKRMVASLTGFGIWLIAAYGLQKSMSARWWSESVYWSFWVVPMIVNALVGRRQEFEADAGAVELTGDPGSYISSLSKLHRLNPQPALTLRLSALLGTHPLPSRRIDAIVQQYGLTAEDPGSLAYRVDEMATLPDRYSTPAAAPDDDRVFSQKNRLRYSGRVVIGLLIFFAISSASLYNYADAHPHGWVSGVVCIGGLFATFAVMMLAAARLEFPAMTRLRAPLEQKLSTKHARSFASAPYIGISPGSEIRTYQGETSWDIGFLLFEDGALEYIGEQTAFTLLPEQITRIEVRARKTMFGSSPRVFVEWRADDGSQVYEFSLESRDAHSAKERRQLTDDLRRQIDIWRLAAVRQAVCFSTNLPPLPDSVLGAALPDFSGKSLGMILGVTIVGAAFLSGALALVSRVVGKEAAESPVLTYGTFLIGFSLVKVSIMKLQKKAKAKR